MKFSNSAKYAIGVSAAVALLAGCSSSGGSQLAPTSPVQQNAVRAGANTQSHKFSTLLSLNLTGRKVRTGKVHSHPIKPNCCAYTKTLFVSDVGDNAVQTYSWPTGTYIGALPAPPEGFSQPQGECVDNHGNVFIANTSAFTVDEYSHSGTFIQALSVPGMYAAGCAYDKTTGNLAVSIIGQPPSNFQGGVAIFAGATGSPTFYTDPSSHLYRAFFLGYNNKGLLYVDGEDSSFVTSYATFSGGTFTPLTLTGTSCSPSAGCSPGFVQWSGKTKSMNIGDQFGPQLGYPTYYQITSTGTVTGSTTVTNSTCLGDIVQGSIKGPRFDGPDNSCADADNYAHPAGGAPENVINSNLLAPVGSAISPNVPGGDDD